MKQPIGKRRVHPNLLNEEEMIALLRSGDQRAVLSGYFGPAMYRELCELARARGSVRKGQRVYLLPGFMGTSLIAGARGQSRLLWLDPAAVVKGELAQLALPNRTPARVFGAILPGCLKLKLILESAGFDVRVFPYDWRSSITQLGKSLARQLSADPANDIMLVAHSMGGLVARAALKHAGGRKVSKLVQLGTPNLGSFALVQALRAVYPTVLKLASLDRQHLPEALTRQVFATLPGVYDMLPRGELAHTDFFDWNTWPEDALKPDRKLLRQARRLPEFLADADRRCHAIVGVGQRTNVGVEFRGAELRYQFSSDGDGTVLRASAAWRGATLWYADVTHGELPKNTAVCLAVADILKQGRTRHLSKKAPQKSPVLRTRREAELRAALQGKVQWEQLPAAERRRLLEPQISSVFRSARHAKVT